jgi:hypothetical protein
MLDKYGRRLTELKLLLKQIVRLMDDRKGGLYKLVRCVTRCKGHRNFDVCVNMAQSIKLVLNRAGRSNSNITNDL